MRFLQQSVSFLLNSNLFIGGCAVAIVCTGNVFLTGSYAAAQPAALVLVGSATFLIYNLTIFLLELRLPGGARNFRRQWFREWAKEMYLLLFLAVVACIVTIFFLPLSKLLFIAHLGVVSILYNVPDRYVGARYRSIRSIPLIKIFLIAYVWAALGAGLPYLQSEGVFSQAVTLFILQFIFIVAITLPFDIRDIQKDGHQQLLTVPAWLGIGLTRKLGVVLMAVYLLLVAVWFPATIVPAALLVLPAGILIWKASPAKPYWYYTGLIDGLILLQLLLLLLHQQL